jgi:small GTP-binding protein
VTDVIDEHDELAKLAQVAGELAQAIDADASRLGDDARFVVERLRERRFDVAVVGEFNRGKSSLLNRLLDNVVLPSGVLPVTSVLTEIAYGEEEQASVRFEDGTTEVIDLVQLERYVTEQENPGNSRKVAGARIQLPANLLRHGAILVDTPGVGSIFRHNSDSAREAILSADGAVMVLSADTPMTEAERALIKLLSRRSERTFFVLNRIDHLEEAELDRVRWFVNTVLQEAFGAQQQIFSVSAKTGEGLDEFVEAFEEFLEHGLDQARLSLARRDVLALADHVENEIALQDSALELNSTELDEKLGQFRRAADWQHDAFADDRVLFSHAAKRIVTELEDRLAPVAVLNDEAIERLHEAAIDVSKADLEMTLDRAIEKEVRALIEPARRREELETERLWRKAAERFERATQRRADKLREIAGELFDVQLHPVQLTQPTAQRGRFFYSAPVHAEPPASMLTRLLRPLLPERRNRERLIQAGEGRFRDEMKRHTERLRDDLSQRLADANRGLEQAMEEQVSQVANAMMRAIERAQGIRESAENEQREQRDRAQRLKEAAERAREAAEGEQKVIDLTDDNVVVDA